MKRNIKHRPRRIKNGKNRGSVNTTWSNDSMGQLDLMPGSLAHKEYVAERNGLVAQNMAGSVQYTKKTGDDYFDGDLEKDVNTLDHDMSPEQADLISKKRKFRSAYLRANAINHRTVTVARKITQVDVAEKVIESGIEENVSKRKIAKKAYDESITPHDFMHESVKDYKDELEEICKKADEDPNDDIELTPGSKRMKKYL